MSFSQIATSVSIISSGLKSYQAISLTNFVASAESLIASGGAIEIANAFFLADGNITPSASSWTLVGTGNVAYITLTPSGSVGVQVLSARYTDTVPFWSTSKGAWYASAGSLTRYVGSVVKTGTSSYEWANLLPNKQDAFFARTFEIGSWDMDAADSATLLHYVPDITTIRDITAIVLNDDANLIKLMGSGNLPSDGETQLWISGISPTHIGLTRLIGGALDDPLYNDAAVNRGFVTIWWSP